MLRRMICHYYVTVTHTDTRRTRKQCTALSNAEKTPKEIIDKPTLLLIFVQLDVIRLSCNWFSNLITSAKPNPSTSFAI